jgi:hypothetical protein
MAAITAASACNGAYRNAKISRQYSQYVKCGEKLKML